MTRYYPAGLASTLSPPPPLTFYIQDWMLNMQMYEKTEHYQLVGIFIFMGSAINQDYLNLCNEF